MRKLRWNLYTSYLIIAALALGISAFCTAVSLKWLYLEHTGERLEFHARLISRTLEKNPVQNAAEIHRLCASFGAKFATRITVVLSSGQVIGDSEISPADMDNHGDRPEIQAAFSERIGISSRYSYTLEEDMTYVAVPVRRGDTLWGAVRTSVSLTSVQGTLNTIYRKIGQGCIAALLLIAAVSLPLSRRISRPLEDISRGVFHFTDGSLQYRIHASGPREINRLANALNRMASRT